MKNITTICPFTPFTQLYRAYFSNFFYPATPWNSKHRLVGPYGITDLYIIPTTNHCIIPISEKKHRLKDLRIKKRMITEQNKRWKASTTPKRLKYTMFGYAFICKPPRVLLWLNNKQCVRYLNKAYFVHFVLLFFLPFRCSFCVVFCLTSEGKNTVHTTVQTDHARIGIITLLLKYLQRAQSIERILFNHFTRRVPADGASVSNCQKLLDIEIKLLIVIVGFFLIFFFFFFFFFFCF